jgi:hypothetical protein
MHGIINDSSVFVQFSGAMAANIPGMGGADFTGINTLAPIPGMMRT